MLSHHFIHGSTFRSVLMEQIPWVFRSLQITEMFSVSVRISESFWYEAIFSEALSFQYPSFCSYFPPQLIHNGLPVFSSVSSLLSSLSTRTLCSCCIFPSILPDPFFGRGWGWVPPTHTLDTHTNTQSEFLTPTNRISAHIHMQTLLTLGYTVLW